MTGGWTNAHYAASNGDLKQLEHLHKEKKLLDAGGSLPRDEIVGSTALHEAARKGHLEVTRWLLKVCGSAAATIQNLYGENPLHRAVQGGHAEVSRCIVTVAGTAAIAGKTDNGSSPLHLAACHGHLQLVKYLLEVGGPAATLAKDNRGKLPLQQARPGEAKELLAEKTAMHIMSQGSKIDNASLMEMLRRVLPELGPAAAAQILPKAQALADSKGQTVAHIAAASGDLHVLSCLLEGGMSLLAKDKQGKTPMALLQDKRSSSKLLPLLRCLGAGAGDALDQAIADDRLPVQLRWCTQPVRKITGEWTTHSFVVVTVRSIATKAQEMYVIEKCELEDAHIQSSVFISFWDESASSASLAVWAQMTEKHIKDKLKMVDLWNAAVATGPFNATSSNSHHAAKAVYNRCAKSSAAQNKLPSISSSPPSAQIAAHRLNAVRTAPATTGWDPAMSPADFPESIAKAVRERTPKLATTLEAVQMVRERFKRRHQVNRKIRELVEDLDDLSERLHGAQDGRTRRALEALANHVKEELEEPSIRYARHAEDVARDIHRISLQIRKELASLFAACREKEEQELLQQQDQLAGHHADGPRPGHRPQQVSPAPESHLVRGRSFEPPDGPSQTITGSGKGTWHKQSGTAAPLRAAGSGLHAATATTTESSADLEPDCDEGAGGRCNHQRCCVIS